MQQARQRLHPMGNRSTGSLAAASVQTEPQSCLSPLTAPSWSPMPRIPPRARRSRSPINTRQLRKPSWRPMVRFSQSEMTVLSGSGRTSGTWHERVCVGRLVIRNITFRHNYLSQFQPTFNHTHPWGFGVMGWGGGEDRTIGVVGDSEGSWMS